MNYLFKLARRTARLRLLPLIALAAALAGCDTDRLTNSSDSPAVPAASEPTAGPLALFSTTSLPGMPFGFFGQPGSVYGSPYTGGKLTTSPGDILSLLAQIKARGGRIVLMLAGFEDLYKDADGHFSLSKWKARVDRFKGIDIASYISDGTIIGHFLIDEPQDPANWNGVPVTGATLEEMAKYSKLIWPAMKTVVRSEPSYLAKYAVNYQAIDAAWAQYVMRRGDAGDFVRRNVADAQKLGIALVVGLNVTKGSMDKGPLTASQLDQFGSALMAESYPCAFVNWRYEEAYLSRTDIKAAMTRLSQKAATHTSRSCGRNQDTPPPVPIPGVKGILMQAVRQVQIDGTQYVLLTWTGATGTRIDIYQNGAFRRATRNDGRGTVYPQKAGKYEYRLCLTGSTTKCSNMVAITIR